MSDELKMETLRVTSLDAKAERLIENTSDDMKRYLESYLLTLGNKIEDLENEIRQLKEHRHYTDIHRDSGLTTEPVSK